MAFGTSGRVKHRPQSRAGIVPALELGLIKSKRVTGRLRNTIADAL
jgi:hypothetical protein